MKKFDDKYDLLKEIKKSNYFSNKDNPIEEVNFLNEMVIDGWVEKYGSKYSITEKGNEQLKKLDAMIEYRKKPIVKRFVIDSLTKIKKTLNLIKNLK
jgi:DNA-binding PadR family transcriptional regulator